MTLGRAVVAAAYLLAAHGVLALLMAGLIGPRAAGLVALGLGASLGRERLRTRLAGIRWRGPVLVALVVVAITGDVLVLAATPFDAAVHALLVMVVLRFCTLGPARDTRAIVFLSFLMLVAASTAALGVGFLLVFVGFVILSTSTLLLEQVLSASVAAPGGGGRRARGGVERGLLGMVALGVVVTLLATAALFIVIPRIGFAALPLRARTGPMVTGFSERVELGDYGEIATDDSVAMRVYLPGETPSPERIPGLRWRGIAFDEFDGRGWRVAQAERSVLRRFGTILETFRVGVSRGRGRLLTQEIYLEPIGSDIIFAAATALEVDLGAETLVVDDMGSLSTRSTAARLHYTVRSEVSDGSVRLPVGGVEHLEPRDRARYLQLPALPARVPALARRVAAGSRDPWAAATRLTEFLSREYRYSLALDRRTALDPIDEFLFVRRSGHCEYFASSLAVMLRTLGIPARVVAGFQRGEWNPYGRYLTVRMRDAHSWVEAHLDGVGWMVLDPSPRADVAAGAASDRFALYVDALRMRWYRHVIHWSLRDQLALASGLGQRAESVRVSVGTGPGQGWWRLSATVVGSAAVVVLIAAARWRWRRAALVAQPAAGIPSFYARGLRTLARRGLRPMPAETAREFVARVARVLPPCGGPAAALTDCYERVRFGSAPLDASGRVAVARALAELAASITAAPAPDR